MTFLDPGLAKSHYVFPLGISLLESVDLRSVVSNRLAPIFWGLKVTGKIKSTILAPLLSSSSSFSNC